jgi:hypothetical protein
MRRKICLVFLNLAVTACAPYEWTREGAGAGEIDQARQECVEESGSYDFLDVREKSLRVMTNRGERYATIAGSTAERQADLFSDCMRAKGFELAPIQED